MIIEYIRYKLESTASDTGMLPAAEFEAAYRIAATALDCSPHCLGYELSRCREEPDQYIMRIEWDSLEGHLSGFRRSKHFRPFLDAIKPHIGSIEEMLHYEVTAVFSGDPAGRHSGGPFAICPGPAHSGTPTRTAPEGASPSAPTNLPGSKKRLRRHAIP